MALAQGDNSVLKTVIANRSDRLSPVFTEYYGIYGIEKLRLMDKSNSPMLQPIWSSIEFSNNNIPV